MPSATVTTTTLNVPPCKNVKELAPDDLAELKEIVQDMVRRCDVPYTAIPFDTAFFDLCCADAKRRGCPMDDTARASTSNPTASLAQFRSIRPKLINGVGMATATFGHLRDQNTKVYIAVYTALLMYVEDYLQNDVDLVSGFNARFVRGAKQAHPVLQALADLLGELQDRFEPVVASIVLTSALNYVSAIWLEHETDSLELTEDAISFPGFSRWLSGSSEAFALFVFASELPLRAYIHAIPDMMTFLNYSNDVLSFYKEELAGESANHISVLARVQGTRKLAVVRRIADETVACVRRLRGLVRGKHLVGASSGVAALEGGAVAAMGGDSSAGDVPVTDSGAAHPRSAAEIVDALFTGYVSFHASLARYRLDELL
ncbi:hypothetical protein HGRIS_010725 [Hohenbuehelia grisea]|uniref:Trichodiene synthase n=1 Tax=Hohenbuehelia grisea TaxID=104357 RepID=A0ABR3IXY8_9AGAR